MIVANFISKTLVNFKTPCARTMKTLSFQEFKKKLPIELIHREINKKILPAASIEALDAAQECLYKHHYDAYLKTRQLSCTSFPLTHGAPKRPN